MCHKCIKAMKNGKKLDKLDDDSEDEEQLPRMKTCGNSNKEKAMNNKWQTLTVETIKPLHYGQNTSCFAVENASRIEGDAGMFIGSLESEEMYVLEGGTKNADI